MIKVVTPPVTIHDVDIVAASLIAHQPYSYNWVTPGGSQHRPPVRLSARPCASHAQFSRQPIH